MMRKPESYRSFKTSWWHSGHHFDHTSRLPTGVEGDGSPGLLACEEGCVDFDAQRLLEHVLVRAW